MAVAVAVVTTTTVNNTKIGTAASYASSYSSSGSVALGIQDSGEPQSGSNDNYNSYPARVCLDTHASVNSTSYSYRKSDCTPCPASGITPLQSTKSVIDGAINSLNIPNGSWDTDYYTNIPQGLFWAWQVLDPSAPFTEGTVTDAGNTPPRAIVLLTDGYNTCRPGDAYQNYYNSSDGCSTWRDNRLKAIADKIKAAGVYIYAIQFAEFNASTETLLKAVATKDIAPYYYYAPSSDDLQSAFSAIATDLSNLRLAR